MGLLFDQTVGLEKVQRGAVLLLIANLPTVLASVESSWAADDAALAGARGVAYVPTTLEPVTSQHMYLGHIPTLIDAPLDHYPNLSVMAYGAVENEGGGGGWDQEGHAFGIDMYIEVMCKSETSEEEVNSRIQRTTEAVNRVILAEPTLGGVVNRTQFSRVDVSDVFVRREEKSRGPRWFWQGSRLEYTIDKPAAYF